MKNKIFSGKLYLQSLLKVRTLGIAMMIAIVLLNIIMPIQAISRNEAFESQTDWTIQDHFYSYSYIPSEFWGSITKPAPDPLRDIEFAPALWLLVLFAPLMVYSMFSFLNERKKSDFYHALPQTRVCVYLSMILAILTWFAGVILVTTLVNTILWSFAKSVTFTITQVLMTLAFYFILAIFMAGFMAVAMMITGTTLSNVLIFGFLLGFPRYVVTLFVAVFAEITPILQYKDMNTELFGFERFLPFAGLYNENRMYTYDIPMLLYSLAVGIVLFALAGFLYHIRRSESASKSAPNKIFQHVYRILFATTVSVWVAVNAFWDSEFEIYLLTVIGTIIVYLLYELMTTKKIGKMVKSLPLLIIPFLLAGVFALTVAGAGAYVYSFRPEADEIASVSVERTNTIYGLKYPEDHALYGEYVLSKFSLDDPRILALVSEEYAEYLDEDHLDLSYTIDCHVTFRMKNGKTVERLFQMKRDAWDEVCTLTRAIDYLPTENIYSYYVSPKLNQNYEITAEGKTLILEKAWKIYCEEYATLTDKEKSELTKVNVNNGTNYIEIYLQEPNAELAYKLDPKLTPKTVAYLAPYQKDVGTLETVKRHAEELYEGTNIVFRYDDGGTGYFRAKRDDFFSSFTIDKHITNAIDGNCIRYSVGFYENGAIWNIYLTDEELEVLLKKAEKANPFYMVFNE